jgi:membrane-associated phospholipid phosphatase
MPDDDPDAFMPRVHVDYPIVADRVIGFGEIPTHRLQRALGRPDEVRLHDYALSWVHWSWFFVPHSTVAWLLLRHHDRFVRGAGLMAATFDLGCIVYWTVPTAPPWYAGRSGRMRPTRRIMEEAGERFWGRAWRRLYDSLQGNPFAAMPSLHFGTSVMAARMLQDVGRGPGALGWSYALTLGFGLVYLGEHYVLDLIAGAALAEGVWRLAPHAEPLVLAAAREVRRLEPGKG